MTILTPIKNSPLQCRQRGLYQHIPPTDLFFEANALTSPCNSPSGLEWCHTLWVEFVLLNGEFNGESWLVLL
jgi:hypothetical protein